MVSLFFYKTLCAKLGLAASTPTDCALSRLGWRLVTRALSHRKAFSRRVTSNKGNLSGYCHPCHPYKRLRWRRLEDDNWQVSNIH
ncbi:hypothetical protein J6590_038713 [Homalodisca vitripennis]|nr:hypothetical protein J6590_038713 [Homalodisca vitripennis]